MSKLALLGGEPVRTRPYPVHRTTGPEEKEAVLRVLDGGVLSAFEGSNNEFFMGGPEVKALEKAWAGKFKTKHAVAVNSATSGLLAAVQASGAGPGDEVIVTPFTMTGTVAGILAVNAVPVFADVDPKTFNLDPREVERKLSPRTKAVLPVHIFGHPADMGPIMDLARPRGIPVIEDAAQSPGALYRGELTGTIGDMGVFSLNCNKHVQCGEGGVVVTNDDRLARRLRLIRNHGEAVIASGMEVDSLDNLLGYNLRMTELEAAVARVQVGKLDALIEARMELVDHLTSALKDVPGIAVPHVEPDCTHVYYRYPLSLDRKKVPVPARDFVRALNAEGMDFYVSYMKPLYLQPLLQKRTIFGKRGCPVSCPWYEGTLAFDKGTCPVAEGLEDWLISTEIVRPPQTRKDMDEIRDAILKVLDNADALAEASRDEGA